MNNKYNFGDLLSPALQSLVEKKLERLEKKYDLTNAHADVAMSKEGKDYAASRGEYLNGKVMAEYLGYEFVDPAEGIYFYEDGTFNAKIDGKSWSGTYTFDEKTHAIDLKGRLLLSLNGFATKNTSGISILFESKKLLTIIQTLTALSGNTTLGTIGEISKNYDGIRVGFDLSK